MSRQRAPWWMFVIAASYLAFLALVFYQSVGGPSEPEGLDAAFVGGGMVVRTVVPNSQSERAGLRPGDRVLAVDRQAIRNNHDWQAIRANTEVGRAERWEVARGGERLQLALAFERPPLSGLLTPQGLGVVVYAGLSLCSFILALVIAFRRPYDQVARVGAWLIATSPIAFGLPDGWAVTWRHLPVLVGALLWVPEVSRFVVDGILLTFFAVFPGKLFRPRWPWVLVWAPVLIGLPRRVSGTYSVIYQPGHATGAPEWIFGVTFFRTVAYLAAGVVALGVNYRRLTDRNQRRRVRVVVAGAVVGLLAALAEVAIESSKAAMSFWAPVVTAGLMLLLLAFPLSFAYAILRHRVFDIQVMIRQGLQYALARSVLISAVPAFAGILVLDLAVHGDQPLINIMRQRGWAYMAVGGLALVAQARRKQWLEALDRRFFRERYDAQRLLREVAEEVREARSFERVAALVTARIELALHPEFVALLVREPREANYRSLAAAPAGLAPPLLSAQSKLMALVRVLGKPVELSLTDFGWLKQQLPHEETDFLRQARIDLLVPIVTMPERAEALLVLGAKRSEEPYSREDLDLLGAITSSLALLLEGPAAPAAKTSEAFKECSECGACYDTGAERCTRDSGSLLLIGLPRLLAGRYRLDRRRGRGGMGAVYEALDTALDRRVAVKVIRDELVGNAEAAGRFQREARAAASFTHPNVVTIYDFGVAADTRAFLVMELLEGAALRDELKRAGRLPVARVLSLMRDVCAAVEAAHRRQLVHRDLKLENIFLARSETGETAKVLDFGIAKFLPPATMGDATLATADTGTGALIGTVRYMSPEQLRGGKVGVGWDLWALAVVAYESLTGAHPFTGATAAEFSTAILAGQVTPLSTHVSEPPQSWQEFFARALALDPVVRPASAAKFMSEMEQALS